MTTQEFLSNFWDYYLILEEKFEKSIRYVELNADNYATYSIEFVNQIQTICSEVDVVMKVICGLEDKDRPTIKDYAGKILDIYPQITKWEVMARGITFNPFDGWNKDNASQSLPWWDAYNHIKHNRNLNLKEANLENVLHSLMGLYLLEMRHFKKLADEENVSDIIKKKSALLSHRNWGTRYYDCTGLEMEIISELN